jgi:hypothetical protein
MSNANVAKRDPELVELERDNAVLAFVEEVEGALLSLLMEKKPELGRMLPPCERAFIEGSNRWGWEDTYGVLWNKAQRIRRLYGEPDATLARRACMGSGRCDAKDCRRNWKE